LAAKQGATIDHVGNGRFGINVVAGWNDDEIEMFGVAQLGHSERYEASAEWITIVKRLWTDGADTDFAGRYFSIKSGQLSPKPIQQPHPIIVNAGQSADGIRFGAEHADFSFQSGNVESLARSAASARSIARDEFGRDLGILTFAYVVCRDTEAEALDYVRHYVDDLGDYVAATNLISQMMRGNVESVPRDALRNMQKQYIAGWGGLPLVGTPTQIVGKLEQLAEIGVDGVALVWVDYLGGIKQFNEAILPLMVKAGLRNP
jgi:alkanesulfonate monooxygenase SsuD/methylene tetrahydromethanopterin reductase-like flavin-dependent oxidoreductase (luciferase family)